MSASHDFALGQKLGMEFERFSLRSFIVYRRILVIIIPFVITIAVMVVIYDKGFQIPVIFISFKLFFLKNNTTISPDKEYHYHLS